MPDKSRIEMLKAGNAALQERINQLSMAIELAWGLIANVGEGDWDLESSEWQKAAHKWWDKYGVYACERKEATYGEEENEEG